jgi:hypothetical protein
MTTTETANPATWPWWVVDHVLRVDVTRDQIDTLSRVLDTSSSSDQVVTVTWLNHTLIRVWTRALNAEFAVERARRAIDVVAPGAGVLTRGAMPVEYPGDSPLINDRD